MKRKLNQLYLSPDTVMVDISSEQVFLTGSTFVDHSMGGVDNEEFVSGGTFSDWK